ncbi:MAG: oligosaccharide flippase family protein [Betaproteobacteria bacterium]
MISLSDKAGFLIVANLVKYAVGFVMPMVLVRLLSQTDYGTYQQLVLIGNASLGIMVLGLPTSVYYFYHHVSIERLPSLLAQTTLMLGISGVIAMTAIFLGASHIAEALNNPSIVGLLQVYAVSIVFMIASEHSIHFLIAQNRYRLALGLEVAETIFRVFVMLTPLALGYGFVGLIAGIVIYSLVRFIVRGAYLFGSEGMRFAGWSRMAFPLEQLGYSIPLALMSLTGLIAATFNKGIMAAAFTPAEYAIYSVGILEIPLDVIFQASVANVLRASLPPLVRDGNLVEVVRVMREAVRKLSIIVLPSFVFLLVHSEQFITLLFTNRYAESVQVFQIYVWLVPLHMLVLSPIPQIFGKPRINLYAVLSYAIVLVALSYLLLKWIGFYGPALAMVIATYLLVGVFFVVVLKLTRTTLRRLLPLPDLLRVLAASIVGVLLAQPTHSLTGSGLVNLAVSGFVFSVVYLTTAAIIGVFTPSDYQLMKRWLAKLVPIGRE